MRTRTEPEPGQPSKPLEPAARDGESSGLMPGEPAEAIESEEQLRASNALFRTVADALPVLISYIDQDQRYRFANRAYENWFGESAVTGRLVLEVVGEAAYEIARPAMEQALGGREVRFETRVEYRGVGTRDVSAIYIPDWHNGRVVGLIALVQDVTAERQLERQMRRENRRKDEFLATLPHELRNPLAPIRNAVQILKLPNIDESRREWSRGVIERQVAQMTRLLDDLLEVSRITRNKLELRMEAVPISFAIEAAIEMARPLLDTRGHALEVELPPEPTVVSADPVRLTQILGNLLNNATKYTQPGGRIRINVATEHGEAVVCVQDNGIGMTREQLSHLFLMFEQAPEAIGHSQGGLGVGLAITRGLVELHGGSIEARSEGPGKGSEFIVRLPLRQASSDGIR